jgi:hypothetical protein
MKEEKQQFFITEKKLWKNMLTSYLFIYGVLSMQEFLLDVWLMDCIRSDCAAGALF